MNNRHLVIWGIALAMGLGLSQVAHAQAVAPIDGDASIDVQNFQPAASPYGIFGVDSSTSTRDLQVSGALILNYANEPLRLVPEEGDPQAIIEQQLVADALFAFGLFDVLEIGVGFPIYFVNGVDGGNLSANAADGATIGDLRLRPKYTLLNNEDSPIGLALALQLGIPTGNAEGFTSSGNFYGRPEVLIDTRIDRLLIAANLGANLQETTQFANLDVGPSLRYGLGAQYEVVESTFLVGGEVFGNSTFDDFFSREETPMELLVGVKYRTPVGIAVELGAGTGLVPGYGAPKFRVIGGIRYAEYTSDRDGDGIVDDEDSCPDDPEDKDKFEDADGCPDPDNDQDTIADVDDQCPNDPEDMDGFEDENGCPDPDNDTDGISDEEDKCPNEPGLAELDGCPNKDSDGDGILDTEDKCPQDPEDKDKFEDEDGCPDPDNDKDGIADAADKCPNDPEDIDGFEDKNGCPDPDNDKDGILDVDDDCPLVAGSKKWKGCKGKKKVVLVGDEIKILEKVYFATGKAKIKRRSYGLLDEVSNVLKSNPNVKRIEVQGHTDDRGNDAYNKRLSDKRANAVRDYLVEKGIKPGRLEAKGYGEEQPAEPIKGLKGRALKKAREANRRVQFKILEQERKTKVIEVAPDKDE